MTRKQLNKLDIVIKNALLYYILEMYLFMILLLYNLESFNMDKRLLDSILKFSNHFSDV